VLFFGLIPISSEFGVSFSSAGWMDGWMAVAPFWRGGCLFYPGTLQTSAYTLVTDFRIKESDALSNIRVNPNSYLAIDEVLIRDSALTATKMFTVHFSRQETL